MTIPMEYFALIELSQKKNRGFGNSFDESNEGYLKLHLIQNLKFKYIDLLCLDLDKNSFEIIKKDISLRYRDLKSRYQNEILNYEILYEIVKNKSPHILLGLNKSACNKPWKPV